MKVKAMIRGCNGRMGQMITSLVADDDEIEIVAGIDVYDKQQNDYPVFKTFADCTVKADVIIDFASVNDFESMLEYAEKTSTPVVVCTTGLSPEQVTEVHKSSEKVAMLRSANMSLGINMLLKLLKEATRTLVPANFDIEIIEKHHNQKLDAPSGTALALADSINEELDNQYKYQYDRSKVKKKRDKKEIGFSSVRGGTIVGEHDVIFAGTDEVITFSHSAYSRAVFGKGAIQAAKYLAGKKPGFYSMSDVIEG